MANLFGVDFRNLFAGAMGGLLLPMTLKVRTPGAYNPSNPSGGPNYTEVSYPCKGSVSVKEMYTVDGLTRMREGSAVVLLGTFTTVGIRPKPGDILVATVPGSTVSQDFSIVPPCDYDDAGAAVVMTLKG